MDISNSNLWSVTSSYNTTSVPSTTTGTSGFMDLLASVERDSSSSYLQEMNSYGVEDLGHPPDFSAMSTDEFLAHLLEVQDSLAASGVDISDMTDPSTLTTEELEALQEEMQKGPPPPPPPSMEMMKFNFVDYSSLTEEGLGSLFDYL